jgi:hypothetical protein
MANRGAVRARHDHGGARLAAWPARLRGCWAAVCPATSRLDRGEGQTVWSTGQTWRVSAHASGPPHADLMSGQGNRGRARAGRRAFGSPAGPRPCRQALPPGSTVDAHHAAPAGPFPPAWWVGRGLATRPRAVTPGDPPADAPARGDQHPARIGVRQGPQMHLLADAWRRPSLHPADLRLALPGVPRPRPAVLQPRRPAVPGARHRADGGGAGPAVAGQGDDEGRHSPTRSGP